MTVKSLNGDTAFLLIFSPPAAPLSSPGLFPGSFTILVDPWLVGSATILSSVFATSEQKGTPCISSLNDLEEQPDIILVSQDKPDHCHEETLRQLPHDCQSTILATPAATRKIRSWKHFAPQLIHTLPKYVEGETSSVYRIVLPPFSPRGHCGEVTVTLMPAKRDISGLHNAIGITYRPPCSVLSANPGHYVDLPLSPPTSPGSPMTVASTPRTIVPAPYNDREKTMSVIYSPHGVPYEIIRPYASSHLVAESALPLSALIHSFDRVENPWYLGGNIIAGSPGGVQIARNLLARAWISAHDADKEDRGLSVKKIRKQKYTMEEIKTMLDSERARSKSKVRTETKVVILKSGQEHRIETG